MNDPIENITVDADAMELTLEVTDEVEEPEFVYYGEASRKPTIDDKNGVINIESRQHGIRFHFPFGNITEKCTLTVKIPTSMYENTKMNLTLDAGDVHLTGIPNGEIVADLDAGNLIVSECTLDNIKIDADAGRRPGQAAGDAPAHYQRGQRRIDLHYFVTKLTWKEGAAQLMCGAFFIVSLPTYPAIDQVEAGGGCRIQCSRDWTWQTGSKCGSQ